MPKAVAMASLFILTTQLDICKTQISILGIFQL